MEEPQDPSSVKGSSQRLDKRKGVEVAVHREVPPVPEGPLVMPGSKINDPKFIVSM